ncbi:NAD(P)-dependent oxidoreductase [Bailinhaonella thermotolerans]|uniref:NAD-dependent epimerase/dehydratase family protein n=1 Tax=Bailinhaonella thermotolerans TaxID=1070861 RepID=A0A3A4BPD4_9ACTN|nr:NAD(P)H-binding protein [Bailinhaonella thermotolerans]RJL32884.1 NAD-dependent epimerase/dehydratase family protein [Bailinhaonella thermotolerans]
MKLMILGATGGTGTELVRQALEAGHEVVAPVRNPAGMAVPAHERLSVIRLNVTDAAELTPHVEGRDAVISAIGHRGGGPTTVCRDVARAAGAAMAKTGVRRLLLVSNSGMIIDENDAIYTRLLVKPLLKWFLRHGYADMAEMERETFATDLDWTVVRPPRLTDKPRTGRYRTATGHNVRNGMNLSRADLAHCVLSLAEDPASIRKVVAVAD